MRFVILLGLTILALPLFAAGPVSFISDREEGSFYASKSITKSITKLLRNSAEYEIKNAYQKSLSELNENDLCSFELSQKIKNYLPANSNFESVIYFLRSKNLFDDTVVQILLQTEELEGQTLDPAHKDATDLPKENVKLEKMLDHISDFAKKKTCFDDAYKSLNNEFRKEEKHLKSSQVLALFVQAYKENRISQDLYSRLERARMAKVETWDLSLKNYYQKIRSLRLNYPLVNSPAKSKFVTEKVDKQKMSRRQKLLSSYSDLQIMLMGNVINKLRTRLDSPKIEILVYAPDEVKTEVIALNPMDRFCFCVVKLREEMSLLSLNTYFNGRTPSYIDLVTAAFEIGIIPASEIDTVGSMEEIWNPKKTFMDKAKVWIRTIGGISSIVVPPPYGFIPALALVAIEATSKNDSTSTDPTKLFKCKN